MSTFSYTETLQIEHCNRTFANVARHMENKHPDYIAGAS